VPQRQIFGHGIVDVGIRGGRSVAQQGRRRHDLTGLAVAALRHLVRHPGKLHRMGAVGRQPLNGDDLALHVAGRKLAGPGGSAVQVDGAGAALGDAAAILGPRQAQRIAQNPQQGCRGVHVHVMHLAVNVQLHPMRPITSGS